MKETEKVISKIMLRFTDNLEYADLMALQSLLYDLMIAKGHEDYESFNEIIKKTFAK